MKLSPAAAMIAEPRSKLAWIISGASTFGRRCCQRIRTHDAPIALAASTNSRRRTDRICPRVRRAYTAQVTAAMAMMALERLGPSAPAIAIARMGARAASRRPPRASAAVLAMLRPRVEPEIRDVHHEVGERVHDRSQEGHAQDRREIQGDGGSGRITPEARPAEDGLGQHRAREKTAEGQTEDGHRWDERVAESVAQYDEPLLQSFRASGPHVVLAEDLQHARTRHPRDHRGREVAERERRQDQMENAAAQRLEVAGEQAVEDVEAGARGWRRGEVVDSTATREPAQLVVEEPDHDETEPEDGDGTADERDQPHQVVGKTAARDGRPDARGNPYDDRDDECG